MKNLILLKRRGARRDHPQDAGSPRHFSRGADRRRRARRHSVDSSLSCSRGRAEAEQL
jgi:hypothetical protein